MQFEGVFEIADNDCIHEFRLAEVKGMPRSHLVKCAHCKVEATAGEVAWMLVGGDTVRNYILNEQRQQIDLASMPAHGGPH